MRVGAVTGVVGAAGGLGGFFTPLVMALVKPFTGSYTLGFVLMGSVASCALLILSRSKRAGAATPGPRATVAGGGCDAPEPRMVLRSPG